MNKRIGYVELNVGGEVIPVKFGLYALELFCAEYGVRVHEIMEVFETTDKGLLPKDMIKFLAIAVRSGANYAAEVNGKGLNYYSKFQVYDWIGELGLNSEEASKIMFAFIRAIMTGGTFEEKDEDVEQIEVSEEVKKKDMTLTS